MVVRNKVIAITGVVMLVCGLGAGARAQTALRLATPFTDINVDPGRSITFDVDVLGPQRRVDLAIGDLPDGWSAVLLGGGSEVSAAFADPDDPPQVTMRVTVPADAEPGPYTVTLTGTAGGVTDTLRLTLRVAERAEGAVRFEIEFPDQRGSSTETFTFGTTLRNDSDTSQLFALEASAPRGWTVDARSAGTDAFASVAVDAGSSSGVDVTADPPDSVEDGEYEITATAEAGDGTRASVDLTVVISGAVRMVFRTSDDRLNASARPAAATSLALEVRNDGTSVLENVFFTSQPPADWTVVYEPSQIDAIAEGDSETVTAFITPSESAVPGDYQLTLIANGPVNRNLELRVSVRQGAGSGIFGLLVIAATIGGIRYAFRRYGRR